MSGRPGGPRGPEPAYTGMQGHLDPRNAFNGQQYQQRYYESESDVDDQFRRDSYAAENGSNPALADSQYYGQDGGYDPYCASNFPLKFLSRPLFASLFDC